MVHRVRLDRGLRIEADLEEARVQTLVPLDAWFGLVDDPDVLRRRLVDDLLDLEHRVLHALYANEVAVQCTLRVLDLPYLLLEGGQLPRNLLDYEELLVELLLLLMARTFVLVAAEERRVVHFAEEPEDLVLHFRDEAHLVVAAWLSVAKIVVVVVGEAVMTIDIRVLYKLLLHVLPGTCH